MKKMKVAIAGFGVEGQASYRYYSKLGADITIVDEKNSLENLPEGAKTILGEGAFEKLHDFELVIRSPQINPARIFTHGKIWSATNEFFAKCPVPIIGVTGTKGKGTTATLISKILEEAGVKTWLVGNIGVPAIDLLAEIEQYAKSNMQNGSDSKPNATNLKPNTGVVVFELSSFQLWDLEKSPETAVILMIEPDHLDVHASMEEYVNAKANIALHQATDDLLVYHPTNELTKTIVDKSGAKKKRYLSDEGAHIVDDHIVIEVQEVCSVKEVGLTGSHNLENICAAITASWRYTQDIEAIKQAVTNFKGLPHRLEFVRELDGVKYYNDSFSSAVSATVAAIKSFDQPLILIAGGYEKNGDFRLLAEAIKQRKSVKKVLLIGEVGDRVGKEFAQLGLRNVEVIHDRDFVAIVQRAKQLATSGDAVLLSPGTSSFDMFKNFYERGDQFKKLVMEL